MLWTARTETPRLLASGQLSRSPRRLPRSIDASRIIHETRASRIGSCFRIGNRARWSVRGT